MIRFFTSRGFRVLLAVVCVLAVVSGGFALAGRALSPQSDLLGAILSPLQKLGGAVTGQMERFFTAVGRLETLEEENNALREELRTYREQLVEYDRYQRENAFYKDFLEMKEQHADYAFQPATVTARDAADACGSFTIDAGRLDGVALHDPVITGDGLVGYVADLGNTMATVVTVLDPKIGVGAVVSRTREAGVVRGDQTLVEQGVCSLSYLQSAAAVSIGDTVITSGAGGVFPKGLIIGTVTEVRKDASNVSLQAVVKPTADLQALTQVMVITDFEGQGGLGDEK